MCFERSTAISVIVSIMPAKKKKLRLGATAMASVAVRYLHPAKLVAEKIPNPDKDERLDDLFVDREEVKLVRGKPTKCIVMKHIRFGDNELHSVPKWVRVTNKRVSSLLKMHQLPRKKAKKLAMRSRASCTIATLAGALARAKILPAFDRLALTLMTTMNLRRRTFLTLAVECWPSQLV